MENEWLESRRNQRGWALGAGALLTAFSFPVWAGLFGLVQFFPGARLATSGSIPSGLFILPIVLLIATYALVSPFLKADFLVPGKKPLRFFLPGLLWMFPLVAFGYWIGDFRTSLHFFDYGLSLAFAIGMPLIIYWRTGCKGFVYVGVAAAVFFSVFVMDDLLGPFSSLWVYVSLGAGFYSIRTLCLGAALLIAAFAPVPRVGRVRYSPRPILYCLAVASLVIEVGTMWSEVSQGRSVLGAITLAWLGYLGVGYFSRRQGAERIFVLSLGMFFLSLLIQIVYGVRHGSAGTWELFHLLVSEMGLVVLGREITVLVRRAGSSRPPRRTQEPAASALHT